MKFMNWIFIIGFRFWVVMLMDSLVIMFFVSGVFSICLKLKCLCRLRVV